MSLKFGTSGLRGLAVDLRGPEARRYVAAFLRYLDWVDEKPTQLFLGRDLRASSAQIVRDCAAAAAGLGYEPVDCGALPTPALALHAMAAGAPAIMVTGSHIPADRNGLKFYRRDGEIAKADEAGILSSLGAAPVGDYSATIRDDGSAAAARYRERYAGVLPADALAGWRIGVFEHSSVGRAALADILAAFGAQIIRLGRVEEFVAVDTEAFADAVFAPLRGWLGEHRLDAIVSADGDADRPLLMDGKGNYVRGDVLGLLAARFLGADVVATPVTSNTAIEATGSFSEVVRTRVGSPYVIEAMQAALEQGARCVVGFEANGGTLLGSAVNFGSVTLPPLMTRDAVLPLVGALGLAAQAGKSLAELVAALPLRVALSDRLADIPQQASATFLERLCQRPSGEDFFGPLGPVARVSAIDGLQSWLADGTMIHYRASGNAPELRCYVEAATAASAQAHLAWALAAARTALSR